jgi:L-ascorbate metabolism protein UlaG (beta-lactamase superfamily)
MSVQLEFVGHACFRLLEDGKPTIVMDPYSFVYLPPYKTTEMADDGFLIDGDTVIVSSLTDDAHDNVAMVRGQPRVINALDVATGKAQATINGEPVVAIAAREIRDHPEHITGRDNALFAFKAGGLWFAHLGDLGIRLSNEELEPWVNRCDVMLAITGEKNTIKLDELDPIIEFLKPTWIVPMHYAIPPMGPKDHPGGGMTTVDVFLNHRRRDHVIIARHHMVSFPMAKLDDGRPTIVVLDPSGYQATGGLPEFRSS